MEIKLAIAKHAHLTIPIRKYKRMTIVYAVAIAIVKQILWESDVDPLRGSQSYELTDYREVSSASELTEVDIHLIP